MSKVDTQNAFSRPGADELKQKIEAYWRDRGAEVAVYLHQAEFHPTLRTARVDLRSDMVNGFPRLRRAVSVS